MISGKVTISPDALVARRLRDVLLALISKSRETKGRLLARVAKKRESIERRLGGGSQISRTSQNFGTSSFETAAIPSPTTCIRS
jgi:hypothetical protein